MELQVAEYEDDAGNDVWAVTQKVGSPGIEENEDAKMDDHLKSRSIRNVEFLDNEARLWDSLPEAGQD